MRNHGYCVVHGVHLRVSAEQRCGEIWAVGSSSGEHGAACLEGDRTRGGEGGEFLVFCFVE